MDQLVAFPDMPQELRTAVASELASRMQMAYAMGYTHDGLRNIAQVCGYKTDLSVEDYRLRYERGGIAACVVEALPKASWRGGVELIEDETTEESTEFEQAWEDFSTRLRVVRKLLQLDVLSQLSTFAVLLIGDGGDLDQPLGQGKDQTGVIYLSLFLGSGGPSLAGNARRIPASMTGALASIGDATIQTWDENPKSPRYGLPETYQLRRTSAVDPSMLKPVHWSRIVHVAERCIDDDVFGRPALERVWNLLDDLDKVVGGGAEAYFQRANQGRVWTIDKDIVGLSPEEKADMREQVEKFQHNLTRDVRARGLTLDTTGSDVANFNGPADAIETLIAGAVRIPKRILTGSEMGELASSQDRENWKDQVNGRREQQAEPIILRPLADRLIEHGFLPTPKQYNARWGTILNRTLEENLAGITAWAAAKTDEGPIFVRDEIRAEFAGKGPLDAEQLASIEEAQAAKADAAAALIAAKPAAFPRAAEGVDEELVEILAAAIESGATSVIDEIIGVQRDAGSPDQPRDEDGKWTDSGSTVTSEQYTKQKTREETRTFAKQKALDVAKTYTTERVDALGGFREQRKEAEQLADIAGKEGGFPVHEAETFHYTFVDAVVSTWRTTKALELLSPESRQRKEAWKKRVEDGKA